MTAFILRADGSLSAALDETIYPQAVLAANPLTTALAADFDPVLAQWHIVNGQEIQLRIALVKGSALISAADDTLDDLVDSIATAILLEVQNNRKAPKYLLYFGTKSRAELKRPVLGGQLATMRQWVPSLKASDNPTLKDLGTKLETAVAKADTAIAGLAASEQQNREFRTTGARRALIDSLNAVRKSVYGKLTEMPHSNPSANLPATFADRFFRAAPRADNRPATAEELQDQITSLEAQLAEAKAQLTTMNEAADAEAKAKADAAARDAAIAEAEKEAAAAAAKVAALKAKK